MNTDFDEKASQKILNEQFNEQGRVQDSSSDNDLEYFDRDAYAQEQEEKLIDAAIEADKERQRTAKKQARLKEAEKRGKARKSHDPVKASLEPSKPQAPIPKISDDHLAYLDKLRAWEQQARRKRHELEQQQQDMYGRGSLAKKIEILEEGIALNDNWWGKITSRYWKLRAEKEAHEKTLANIDMRIREQQGQLAKELESRKPEKLEPRPELQKQELTPEEIFARELEKTKRISQKNKELDKDRDLGL